MNDSSSRYARIDQDDPSFIAWFYAKVVPQKQNFPVVVDDKPVHEEFSDLVQQENLIKNMSVEESNVISSEEKMENREQEKQHCDFYIGSWVQDENYPLYQPFVCPFVDEGFKCQENGRLDRDYLKWRWQPRDCDLPRFNATDMLRLLKNKRLLFIGDSIGRNQWESLVCMLYEKVSNRSNVFEARGQRITKARGSYTIKFRDYNVQIEYYRSHFLVRESKRPPGSSRKIRSALRLDKVDTKGGKWNNANILVFNSGHWWNHAKIKKGKCYFIEGDNYTTNMDVVTAYEKAMRSWSSWVDTHADPRKTRVFFRGYAPSHFSGGHWDTGGSCSKFTQPVLDEKLLGVLPNKVEVMGRVISSMNMPVTYLNITRLSEFRTDAHVANWGHILKPGQQPRQDCSHWCLPGLPDTWNEILYASML